MLKVASWSLTEEVAGSRPFNDKYFLSLNSVKHLRQTSMGGNKGKQNDFWNRGEYTATGNNELLIVDVSLTR